MAKGNTVTLAVNSLKRCCPVCLQARAAKDKTPDGQVHCVLGRSNKIWCPYADPCSILDAFEEETKEKTREAWRRANEIKRLKKQQQQQITHCSFSPSFLNQSLYVHIWV